MRRRIASVLVVPLFLAACSASGGAAESTGITGPAATPSSAGGAVECPTALNAMADYGTAIGDLARSVEANDAMAAVAASDAMLYAIDQLMPVINEVGEPARAFAAEAWAVATLVKGAVANGTTMRELLPQLTEAFRDPAFATGGSAIESYVDQRCGSAAPPTEVPGPS